MEGVQERLGASLQRRLSLALCGVIVLVAVLAGGWSFATAWQDAQELQDAQLLQLSALVSPRGAVPAAAALRERPDAGDADDGHDGEGDPQVLVQWLRTPTGPAGPALFAADLPPGLQTVTQQGEHWRVLVKRLDAGTTVALAQRTTVRDEVAQDAALRTVMPLLVLVPLLLLLVAVLIRQLLAPLNRLAAQLDARSEQDLRPVHTAGLPSEVGPLLAALNRTLQRVAGALAQQQRFVADAAHELRSPLTAVSLHAEQLAASDLPDPARERVAKLQAGMARSRSLVDQMLVLARSQAQSPRPAERVDLRGVMREVLEELVPLAQHQGVDLGVVDGDPAQLRQPLQAQLQLQVLGDRLALFTLIKNLVDNAVRYTPAGGRVDLAMGQRTDAGRVWFSVSDNGPGIDATLRERVFDPFYRVLGSGQAGSGLGLAIVRSTAEQLGARLSLDDAHAAAPEGERGLRVRVSFPPV
jgi:two-component system, OmpR family, sensor kinase